VEGGQTSEPEYGRNADSSHIHAAERLTQAPERNTTTARRILTP